MLQPSPQIIIEEPTTKSSLAESNVQKTKIDEGLDNFKIAESQNDEQVLERNDSRTISEVGKPPIPIKRDSKNLVKNSQSSADDKLEKPASILKGDTPASRRESD